MNLMKNSIVKNITSFQLYIIKTNKHLDQEIEKLRLKYKDKNWIILSSTK
jgi:hypothetical protein